MCRPVLVVLVRCCPQGSGSDSSAWCSTPAERCSGTGLERLPGKQLRRFKVLRGWIFAHAWVCPLKGLSRRPPADLFLSLSNTAQCFFRLCYMLLLGLRMRSSTGKAQKPQIPRPQALDPIPKPQTLICNTPNVPGRVAHRSWQSGRRHDSPHGPSVGGLGFRFGGL